jgi:hypothetical protein
MHVIAKKNLTRDSVSRVPDAFLLGVYQGYALGGSNPVNRLVDTRIGAEPERVQVSGEEEIRGSGVCLTERQLANGPTKRQLGKLRVNLAGLFVGHQGSCELARILGISSAPKAFIPFVELPGA